MLKKIKSIPVNWRLFIVICLLIGIFFRFGNLDGKVYEYDETYTSIRVSGYTEAEAVKQLSSAGLIRVEDLIKHYQSPSPDKTVLETVKGLAVEEAQLTPLYFITARFWTERLGYSVATIRSLSAFANLLAFPCMWWLCLELFESPIAASIGVVLLAISPFQILYAKQARPISFWILLTILSSALLLRAIRVKTRTSWLLYTIALTTSLYTFLFAALTAIAHGIYVFINERFRLSKTLIWFSIALSVSTLAFTPWLLIIISNLQQVQKATSEPGGGGLSFVGLYKVWVTHLNLTFVDPYAFEGSGSLPSAYHAGLSLLCWAVRLLTLFSFYVLCRQAPKQTWLFVVCLTVVPIFFLASPDLILHSSRSMNARYVVPVFLGFQLAITYLWSRTLTIPMAKSFWYPAFWRFVAVLSISASIATGVVISQADSWWTQVVGHNNPKFAQMINRAEHPLVISDAVLGDLLSLSHSLNLNVQLLVRPQCFACDINREFVDTPYLPEIPAGFSDVFLYQPRPSETWLNRIKQQQTHKVRAISQGFDNWFWKIDQ